MKSIQHSLIRLTAVLLCAVTLWGCKAPDGGSETTTTLGEPMPNIPAQPSERESMAKSMVENLYHWYQEKGGSGDSAYINLHEYHNSTQSPERSDGSDYPSKIRQS